MSRVMMSKQIAWTRSIPPSIGVANLVRMSTGSSGPSSTTKIEFEFALQLLQCIPLIYLLEITRARLLHRIPCVISITQCKLYVWDNSLVDKWNPRQDSRRLLNLEEGIFSRSSNLISNQSSSRNQPRLCPSIIFKKSLPAHYDTLGLCDLA